MKKEQEFKLMYFDYLVDMPDIIKNDFINLMCGKCIGSGAYRQVYDHKYDDNIVIKIETRDSKIFANIREWITWCEVQDTPLEKWFAPCIDISENGLILIQAKTKIPKTYPIKIPNFFVDTKYQNFGIYKGKLVCHDYAGNKLFRTGRKVKLIRPDWWSDGTRDKHWK